MFEERKSLLTLSFSWIGASRPFSWKITGGMWKGPPRGMALARDAYTPSWTAGQKMKVSKKKPCGKKTTAKKVKRVTKKKKKKAKRRY